MSDCDGHRLLRRALERHADASGTDLTIVRSDATRWASATFAGARHVLELTLRGTAAAAWLRALPEAELTLGGHLVADLTIVTAHFGPVALSATVEALTVEEDATV